MGDDREQGAYVLQVPPGSVLFLRNVGLQVDDEDRLGDPIGWFTDELIRVVGHTQFLVIHVEGDADAAVMDAPAVLRLIADGMTEPPDWSMPGVIDANLDEVLLEAARELGPCPGAANDGCNLVAGHEGPHQPWPLRRNPTPPVGNPTPPVGAGLPLRRVTDSPQACDLTRLTCGGGFPSGPFGR